MGYQGWGSQPYGNNVNEFPKDVITLVGGTIATAEDTLEATTTMVMVLHLF